MILHLALVAAFLQGTPANAQSTARNASVAGVVLNSVTGEPAADVRVSLAKLGVSLGPLSQMLQGQGGPAVETTLPGEFFAALRGEAARLRTMPPEEAARAAALVSVAEQEPHEIIVGPGGTAVVLKSTPPALTDAQGRFAFNDVEPGTYRLIFTAAGYARADYGQRVAGAGGVPMILGAGEKKTDVVMRLAPVGAISGHILDSTGQPVAAVPVQLSRFVYDQAGQRRVQRIASTRSDDRGEYRMFYLPQGRYYLSAGDSQGPRGPLGGSGGYMPANGLTGTYAITYYPGVVNENQAVPIEIPPGGDVTGMDLFVGVEQSYRVRGRIVDLKTGQPPAAVSLSLRAEITDVNISATSSIGEPIPSRDYKAADGTFDLPGARPGAYTVTAALANPASSVNTATRALEAFDYEALKAADLVRPRASVGIRVVNTDVDGILLALTTGSTISGRIRLDPSAANREMPNLDFVRVQLRRPTAGPVNNMNDDPQPQAPKADGSFSVQNVFPGEHRVSVVGLPDGFYVKEARLGEADVLNSPLRFSGSGSDAIDIVISPNVGTIEGTASPGVQVVLIPSRRERAELFRSVVADSSGRFTIRSVAPGDYVLAAWEALEPYSFFDRTVIEQAEANGKAIRVSESSSQVVNVTPMK